MNTLKNAENKPDGSKHGATCKTRIAGHCRAIAEASARVFNRGADGSAILNRDLPATLPSDGFYHLLPIGEFPGVLQGPKGEREDIVQVLDRAALEAMVQAFNGQLLIDYDHLSHDLSQPTKAAGWIEALELRTDGIWSRNTWSNHGKADIEGRAYRFISPELADLEHLGGNRYRPRLLTGAGITNRPNLKTLSPLANREPNPSTPIMDYKAELIKMLGLAAQATDQDITAALAKASADAVDPEEVEALRTENRELLAAVVEGDLEAHKGVIKDRETVKKALMANRAGTLQLLASLNSSTAPKPPLTNRKPPQQPQNSPTAAEAEDPKVAARAGRVSNRAAEIQRTERVGWSVAWNRAEAEIPRD